MNRCFLSTSILPFSYYTPQADTTPAWGFSYLAKLRGVRYTGNTPPSHERQEASVTLKLEIKLDEEKVRAEQKYSPAAIYSVLDKAFLKHHFRKMERSAGFWADTISRMRSIPATIPSTRQRTWRFST